MRECVSECWCSKFLVMSDTRIIGDSMESEAAKAVGLEPSSEPAGQTLSEIFDTYSASAIIGDRVIRGSRALWSPRHKTSASGSVSQGLVLAAERSATSTDTGTCTGSATALKIGSSSPKPWRAGVVPASKLEIDPEAARAAIGKWAFDAFTFSELPGSRQAPLVAAAMAVLQTPRYNIFADLSLPREKLISFLVDVENAYFSFAYHNHIHACDTVQAVHFLLSECGLHSTANLTPLDTLSLVLSTAMHDVGHPGLNNGFHVATRDSLAISYHDVSVLENYHAGIGMQLLSRPANNFLGELFARGRADKSATALAAAFRRSMVELVLATDLSKHKDILAQFKQTIADSTAPVASRNTANDARRPSGSSDPATGTAAAGAMAVVDSSATPVATSDSPLKRMLLKMAIKAADISHPTRRFEVHRKFSEAIQQEFFEQVRANAAKR